MVSVYAIDLNMKLSPSIDVEYERYQVDGVDLIENEWWFHRVREVCSWCEKRFARNTPCLHYGVDKVLVPCYECEEFTTFKKMEGV